MGRGTCATIPCGRVNGRYFAMSASTFENSSAARLYTSMSDAWLRSGMSRKILSTLCFGGGALPSLSAPPFASSK